MRFLFSNISPETFWILVGLTGQALFFMRFFIQWLATEMARKSVVPTSFWYFSLAGGAILLTYSIYRQDPVFILGQSLGLLIYIRNLYFVIKKPNLESQ